jgi:hypothetical protein
MHSCSEQEKVQLFVLDNLFYGLENLWWRSVDNMLGMTGRYDSSSWS